MVIEFKQKIDQAIVSCDNCDHTETFDAYEWKDITTHMKYDGWRIKKSDCVVDKFNHYCPDCARSLR